MDNTRMKKYFKENSEKISILNASRTYKGCFLFVAYLVIMSIIMFITKERRDLVITYLCFLPIYLIQFFLAILINKKKITRHVFSQIVLLSFIVTSIAFGFTLALLDLDSNATMLLLLMVVVPLFFIVNIYHVFIFEGIITIAYLITSYILKEWNIFTIEFLNMIAVLLICYILGQAHLKLLISEYEANNSLKSLSEIDYLTSLPNRRSLDKNTSENKEIKNPITLMMMDIDNFKQINDKYGHLMGDRILQEISMIFKEFLSSDLSVVRYGGEEFLFVATNMSEDDMLNIGKQIQSKLRLRNIDGFETSPTISGGISSSQSGDKFENGISKADIALYVSKNNGKNQITIYKSDMKKSK